MAELLLKVGSVIPGDHSTWQDGDIISAFNSRRIRCSHAEQICHHRRAGFSPSGLRESGTLFHSWMQKTQTKMFVRVSKHELKRVNLADQSFDIISNIPNEAGEAIHLEEYIRHALQHPNHRIFGVPGAEFWYGGRADYSNAVMDLVWTDIELLSEYREANHRTLNLSDECLRRSLAISCDDFDEREADELEASEVDDNWVDPADRRPGKVASRLLKQRRCWVNWRDDVPVRNEDVDNPNKVVDERDPDLKVRPREQFVRMKP